MKNECDITPDTWLDRYGDYLFRYAMFRLRDKMLAEDAVQDTLLAAMQSHDRFDRRSSEKTWLVGILKHKIIDQFRRGASRHEIHYEQEVDDSDPFETSGNWAGHWQSNYAPTDWQLDASAVLERKEFWTIFERCLGALPELTATTFVLREIDGLSSEEICAALNISRNNLWVRLHRARLKLRESLEGELFQNRGSSSFVNRKMTQEGRTDAGRVEPGMSYRVVVA